MKQNDNKRSIIGGIAAGMAFGVINFLPPEFRNILPLPVGVIGLFFTIYLIIKHRPLWEIVICASLTICLLMFFVAYLEHKYFGTERVLILNGIFGYILFMTMFSIITIRYYKKGDVIKGIFTTFLTVCLIVMFIIIVITLVKEKYNIV